MPPDQCRPGSAVPPEEHYCCREMPSFFIFFCNVERFIPRRAATPFEPANYPAKRPRPERSDVRMLRIQRCEQGEGIRFMLSGHIEAEYLPELRRLIAGEGQQRLVTLDLGEVKLVDLRIVY